MDACVPGDIVTICGIVNFINTNVDVGGSGKSFVDLETVGTCCIQRILMLVITLKNCMLTDGRASI